MAFELFMSCVSFWFQKGKVLKFKIIETVCILLKGYGYCSVQTATIHGHVLVVPVHQCMVYVYKLGCVIIIHYNTTITCAHTVYVLREECLLCTQSTVSLDTCILMH